MNNVSSPSPLNHGFSSCSCRANSSLPIRWCDWWRNSNLMSSHLLQLLGWNSVHLQRLQVFWACLVLFIVFVLRTSRSVSPIWDGQEPKWIPVSQESHLSVAWLSSHLVSCSALFLNPQHSIVELLLSVSLLNCFSAVSLNAVAMKWQKNSSKQIPNVNSYLWFPHILLPSVPRLNTCNQKVFDQ